MLLTFTQLGKQRTVQFSSGYSNVNKRYMHVQSCESYYNINNISLIIVKQKYRKLALVDEKRIEEKGDREGVDMGLGDYGTILYVSTFALLFPKNCYWFNRMKIIPYLLPLSVSLSATLAYMYVQIYNILYNAYIHTNEPQHSYRTVSCITND